MSGSWVEVVDCDSRIFRNMLGSFMTGVAVVSTRAADGLTRAFTANSFTSVSLDPPLVLICLAKSSASIEIFAQARAFSISVLGEWQRDMSNAFASRHSAVKAEATAKLADIGVPYVRDSLAVIVCERDRIVDAGDHIILLGAVRRFQSIDGQPLGYFRGNYVGIGPAVRQLEQLGSPLIVGGVLDVGGKVVLRRRPGFADWEIPTTPLAHGEQHSKVLHRLFADLNISAHVTLLYSLFQETNERSTSLIFAVEASGNVVLETLKDGTEIALFGAEDEPWNLIRGEMKQGLLQRYFRERSAGAFGIYFDTADGGRVIALEVQPLSRSERRPSIELARRDPEREAVLNG